VLEKGAFSAKTPAFRAFSLAKQRKQNVKNKNCPKSVHIRQARAELLVSCHYLCRLVPLFSYEDKVSDQI